MSGFNYGRGHWPRAGYYMCNTCGFERKIDETKSYEAQADCPDDDGGQMMGRGWAGWDCENRRDRVNVLKRAGLTEGEALKFLSECNSDLVKEQCFPKAEIAMWAVIDIKRRIVVNFRGEPAVSSEKEELESMMGVAAEHPDLKIVPFTISCD